MGSKSIRYEVLVCPSTTSSSAFKEQQHQQSTSSPFLADENSSATTALFETKVQRFTCDRENMQQYWIPEGFHPVLIPRAYLTDSLVATSNNSGHLMNTVNAGNVIHQLRSRINNDNINDIELRRRNKISTTNNGGISKKRRRNVVNANRRTILGQSPPTVNINTVINRQRIKDIRNSAITITSSSSLKNNNPSDRSPSIIIGEMWKDEPENIKKHYERLAIRKKIAQALAFEQKFSSPSSSVKSTINHVRSTTTTSNSRHHHVIPSTCPTTGSSYRFAVHSNAVEGVDSINGSSFDNSGRQNVDNSATFSVSSSPIISNDSSRHIPDWMTRSDDEDYDENDENSSDIELDADNNNSTITTIA
jgi:hypothetical protein